MPAIPSIPVETSKTPSNASVASKRNLIVSLKRMKFRSFLRNSLCAWGSSLHLQRVAQRFGTARQVVQDALPVALFIIGSARIDVLHAVPQRVIEQHGDLACRGGDRLRLADAG